MKTRSFMNLVTNPHKVEQQLKVMIPFWKLSKKIAVNTKNVFRTMCEWVLWISGDRIGKQEDTIESSWLGSDSSLSCIQIVT